MGHVESCLEVATLNIPAGQNEHGPLAPVDALAEVVDQGASRDPVPFLQAQCQGTVSAFLQMNAHFLHHPLRHCSILLVVYHKSIIDGALGL